MNFVGLLHNVTIIYSQLIRYQWTSCNTLIYYVNLYYCPAIHKFCSVFNRKQDLESHERSGNEDSGDMSEEEEGEEVGVDNSKT